MKQKDKCKNCGQTIKKANTGNIDFDNNYCSSECYMKGEK